MTSSSPVGVQVATPDDAPGLLPLFTAFYREHFQPGTAKAIREHMAAAAAFDTVLVATLGDEVVGFASLRILPQIESGVPHAELADLFVAESQRRRGVGRALLAAAEQLARSRGARALALVTGFDNGGARAFYRAGGLEEFAVTMRKRFEGAR